MNLPLRRSLARLLLAASLVVSPAAVLAAQPGAKTAARKKASAPVQVKGTRVTLKPPEGFTEATRFNGFEQEASGASLMVTEYPGPYAVAVQGFTAENMAKQDMKVLSRKPAKVGRRTGLLLHLRKTGPKGTFLKSVLVLGDASNTVVLNASWPEDAPKALGKALESALRSARWEPSAEPAPGLVLFTLKETPGLKEAQRLQNAIAYTPDGAPPKAPEVAPFFIVLPSLTTASVGEDLEAFNLERLRQPPGGEEVTVESSAPLTVGDLKGHEAVGRAKHPTTGKEFALYQAVLVDVDRYFLLQGFTPLAERATYLEHFQRITRGFQPTASTP
ncbi:hypothetical protein HPC49_02185 [Pyxidicoccus fallax]|uniref:DUF1795 domain-containing protein n=1 Tax=Pyxidicoccus fallax TaxID=394095 RepID=A0A848LCR8_9BACT|nr:hypothetical protein [Pyxidicoccus fallax]NMO14543.1 hypothetical protein [Pyxidicoccus fallax]NPC77062.1 hypothetical protein [Pyxidicoccus fallax]